MSLISPTVVRATDRWERFFAALSTPDIQVLDRASAGHKLKVVCHEMQLSYDTVQKRLKRWQQDLNLPSLNAMLHVWRVVRTQHRPVDAGEPTLLRYASQVATETAKRLARPPPDIAIPAAQRQRQPAAQLFARNAQKSRSNTLLLTQCVLSPALWHALLSIGQELGEHALQRTHVVAQHRLFLHALVPDAPIHPGDRLIADLLNWLQDSDRASSMMSTGRGTPVALAIVVAARRMKLLGNYAVCGAEQALQNSTRSQANAIWQLVAAATSTTAFSALDDLAFLHDVWRDQRREQSRDETQRDHDESIAHERSLTPIIQATATSNILGPMTGMAVAMMATQTARPELASDSVELLPAMVRARLRHAEILGVHPLRLLAHFSMREAGVASGPELFALRPGELLVDEDSDAFSFAEEQLWQRASSDNAATDAEPWRYPSAATAHLL